MANVKLNDVYKAYPDGTLAVNGLTLEVADGEFMVLVGPSGCGKTSALRMVAGLEEISAGELSIGGSVVNDLDPKDRNIAMVFQNYALYPHLTVAENLGFGLRVRDTPRAEIEVRVREIARVLGLEAHLGRKPRNLSGGQRQRVAMGRAMIRDVAVFLMDEPLSNLDAKLRIQMRAEIARTQREASATTIYVTHDQTEAMTMADRVAVMRKGTLQQVDTPESLYDSPANLFVASFIGSPAMNFVQATVEVESDDAVWCRVGNQRLRLPDSVIQRRPSIRGRAGSNVALGIRPEALHDPAMNGGAPDGCALDGTVAFVEKLGSEVVAHVDLEAPPVVSDQLLEVASDLDEAMAEDLRSHASSRVTELVARLPAASRIGSRERVRLSVEVEQLHVFDLESGESLAEPDRYVSAHSG